VVRRHNRLLVAFYVCSDAILGVAAFVLAYVLRFESGLIPITKGYPPFSQYVNVLPFVGVLVPFAFHVQGLYRLRRGRSRVDDFFAVLVGSILAVVFGVVATLYVQAYYVPDELKDRGAYEVSQIVWGLFLVLNVLLTFSSRAIVRELLEQIRGAVTHTGDLLVQGLAVHPALGLRLNGPDHPSELLGKGHQALLYRVGCRRA